MNVTPGTTDWLRRRGLGSRTEQFRRGGPGGQAEGGCKGIHVRRRAVRSQGLFDYGRQQTPRRPRPFAAVPSLRSGSGAGSGWSRSESPLPRYHRVADVRLTAWPSRARARSAPSEAHYALLADFLDGMLEGVLGANEDRRCLGAFVFIQATRSQFEEAYATIKEKSVDWTAAPDEYRRQVRPVLASGWIKVGGKWAGTSMISPRITSRRISLNLLCAALLMSATSTSGSTRNSPAGGPTSGCRPSMCRRCVMLEQGTRQTDKKNLPGSIL